MVALQEQQTTARQRAYQAKLRELEGLVGRLEREGETKARTVLEQVRQEVIEELKNTPPERFRAFFLRELQGSVDRKIAVLEQKLTQEIAPKIQDALEAGRRSVEEPAAVFDVSIPLIDIPQNLVDVVQGFTADLIQRVSDETRSRINADIASAILRGDSILDAARRIGRSLNQPATTFGAITDRTERIARTEILRAYSIAQQAGLRQMADYVPGLKKQWVATLDDRVRPDHRLAHGQIRNWNEPFDVGGEKLLYPRDPAGDPANTIQCRCVSVPVLPEFEQEAALLPPPERAAIPPRLEDVELPFIPPPPPSPTPGLRRLRPPVPLPVQTPVSPLLDTTSIAKRTPALSRIMTMQVTQAKELGGTGITPGKAKVALENGKQAIFKPASRINLHGIRAGTDHVREKAAYLAARHLGFNNVPLTQIRELKGETGSIQLWGKGQIAYKYERNGNAMMETLRNLDHDSLHQMAVLDYVINNRDRHSGNFLIHKFRGKFKVVAIDNGLSFAPMTDRVLNRSGYEWTILDAEQGGPKQLSQKLWDRIKRVDVQALVDDLYKTGLSTSEVEDTVQRLRRVQRYGLSTLFRFPVNGIPSSMIEQAKKAGLV